MKAAARMRISAAVFFCARCARVFLAVLFVCLVCLFHVFFLLLSHFLGG